MVDIRSAEASAGFRLRLLFATLFVAMVALVPARAATTARSLTEADLATWLDRSIPKALTSGDIPGAVVVVVKDGRILFQRGYGYADLQRKTPVDPDRTLFRPGSISKLFTATAIMQLVEQGRLDLDRDVNDYLDFRIAPAFGRPVTLRNLLTHTSGFAETVKGAFLSDAARRESLEAYVKRHVPQRIYPPAEVPAYSNYGISLAGYVIQRVSGEPFDDYIDRHIFRPLGMAHSTFRQPLPAPLQKDMALGYGPGSDNPRFFEIVATAPSGGASLAGVDMARFMIAHLQDGRLGQNAILRPETARVMHRPVYPRFPGLNVSALGFKQYDTPSRRIIGHGGTTMLFHSHLMLLPDENAGLFFSFNSLGKDRSAYRIASALSRNFTSRYFPDPSSRKQAAALPTARVHARMAAGLYEGSRRWEGNFFSILNLDQTKVTANDDGTINMAVQVDSPVPVPKRWREIAPFLWEEVGGADRLGMVVRDGRVISIQESALPAFALVRAPAWRSSTWNIPLLVGSLAVIILTILSWPIAALAGRLRGVPTALVGRERLAHRLARIGAVASFLFIAGFIWILSFIAAGRYEVFGPQIDPWLRLFQIFGLFGLAGAFAAVWSAWLSWQAKRPWWARLSNLLLAGALFGIAWIAFAFDLISPNLNY